MEENLTEHYNKLKENIRKEIKEEISNELIVYSKEEIGDKLKKILSFRIFDLSQEYKDKCGEIIATLKTLINNLEENINSEKDIDSMTFVTKNLWVKYAGDITAKIGFLTVSVMQSSIMKELEKETPQIVEEIINKRN